MPVINDESTGFGIGSYVARNFSHTTAKDCDRGNELVWDEIVAAQERLKTLRQEAIHWLDLRDAIKAYGVETAGELPESIFKRHKAKLDRPIIVMN